LRKRWRRTRFAESAGDVMLILLGHLNCVLFVSHKSVQCVRVQTTELCKQHAVR
jgi:hypothetical protein